MPSTLTASTASTARASGSRVYGASDNCRSAMKCREKFSDATRISAHSVSSMAGELKYATLASCVEKAPRPTAEKQWQTASSQDIPAIRSATIPTAVMAQYTNHSDL